MKRFYGLLGLCILFMFGCVSYPVPMAEDLTNDVKLREVDNSLLLSIYGLDLDMYSYEIIGNQYSPSAFNYLTWSWAFLYGVYPVASKDAKIDGNKIFERYKETIIAKIYGTISQKGYRTIAQDKGLFHDNEVKQGRIQLFANINRVDYNQKGAYFQMGDLKMDIDWVIFDSLTQEIIFKDKIISHLNQEGVIGEKKTITDLFDSCILNSLYQVLNNPVVQGKISIAAKKESIDRNSLFN